MLINIGDRVRFLNAVGGGIVRRIEGKDIVWVEEEDGFDTPVLMRECIVVEGINAKTNFPEKQPVVVSKEEKIPEDKTKAEKAYEKSLRELVETKNNPVRKQNKPTENTPVIIEIDLHINSLLDTVAGMSRGEMLDYQMEIVKKTIAENKNKKGQKIVFIHGKGDGILRNKILHYLKTNHPSYYVQDASFREYGFGASMITIK